MQAYILVGETAYPVDTGEEIQVAAEALRDARLASAPVWVGRPPEGYRNGAVMHAAKPAARDGATS